MGQFSDKYLISGMAALITIFFLLSSPAALSRRHQRPHPLSSLKKELDIYMLLTWSRGMLGVVLAICGAAFLEITDIKQNEDAASSPVLLLLGWFLLSSFSNKVFTYPPPDRAVHGRWRWSVKTGVLFFTRGAGLFMIVTSAILFTNLPLTESILGLGWGIVFIFIRQIKQFFTGAAQFSAIVSLTEQYKQVQRLPAAHKGTAFCTFLNRLFKERRLVDGKRFHGKRHTHQWQL
jgi:hypothetical protein